MIIGVDEVGRGCWAGPLVAAAVELPEVCNIAGLDDSKKISFQKRLIISDKINKLTSNIGIGWVWPEEINKLGLSESVRQAMKRAISQLNIVDNQKIIVDGNINYLKDYINSRAEVKADGKVPAVSAASIIAKVARDDYMFQLASHYPDYGFERHVGYGTKFHLDALLRYGVTDQHRINYKPIKALTS